MPIHTFICPKCNLESVEVVRRNDPYPHCPYCHLEMEKRICDCNFILKGSGFHNTDYTHHGPKLKGRS